VTVFGLCDPGAPLDSPGLRPDQPVKETTMANYSRWDDTKNKRRAPSTEVRAEVESTTSRSAS
jgi:hypothetical protein